MSSNTHMCISGKSKSHGLSEIIIYGNLILHNSTYIDQVMTYGNLIFMGTSTLYTDSICIASHLNALSTEQLLVDAYNYVRYT